MLKGIPSTLKGIPSTPKGVPSMLKGIPSTLKGIPSTLKGIPSTLKGIPSTLKGIPSTLKGIPSTLKGIPLETELSDSAIEPGNYTPESGVPRTRNATRIHVCEPCVRTCQKFCANKVIRLLCKLCN